MPGSRSVWIGGKRVSFSSRVNKQGETVYYRSGKRQTSPYGKRLAKGILAGLSPQQARGHDPEWKTFRAKALTQNQIRPSHEGAGSVGQFGLENWGASFQSQGETPSSYYADVRVTKESLKRRGSGTEENDDECQIVTLLLTRPVKGNRLQQTFSKIEIRREFRAIMDATLAFYRLSLCSGSLEDDLVGFWRHSER